MSVPRWAPEALRASPRAAAFVARCFGRAVALVGVVGQFEAVLGAATVTQLAVDQLLLLQARHLLEYTHLGAGFSQRKKSERVRNLFAHP